MALYGNLTGSSRDSAAALTDLFKGFDLQSLAPKIIQYLQEGLDENSIYVLLQKTPEWKDRFRANERRKKLGLSVLTPQEYIAAERGYRRALQAAGIPKGMWDSREDFTSFLTQDVSPDEVAERAQKARETINTMDATDRRALAGMGIDAGHLAAYFLNPTKALPVLEKQKDIAFLAAERMRAGFKFNKSRATELYKLGIDIEQARAGYSTINEALPNSRLLSNTRGAVAKVGVRTLEKEVFNQSADATRKRRALASQERARFAGSGGMGDNTFATDRTFN